jgi:presenilin-like A22 family membrane protease
MNLRALGGALFAGLVFLLVQLGALALVGPFQTAGYQAVADPSDPTNSVLYLAAILVVTALMLAAFKYDFERAVKAVVVASSAMLSWYVFSVVVPPLLRYGGVNVLAVAASVGVAVALVVYPEWYVIDAAGVLMGAGAAGLFGISFGLLPAIVLLAALAVYDAISVYGTRHMLSLAEGVMDLRIPVILVVPLTLSYSLLDDDFSGAADVHEDDESDDVDDADGDAGAVSDADEAHGSTGRDAFFIGLGDAVMPTVMIASGAFFSPAASLGVGFLPALNLPALAAMAGTLAGLAVLLAMVLKGRAHAGLPLLNGGAIGGYLVGSLLAGVPLLRAIGL